MHPCRAPLEWKPHVKNAETEGSRGWNGDVAADIGVFFFPTIRSWDRQLGEADGSSY